MSAEIQTGLFILTAEVAGITTLTALAAGIVAWVRHKARLRAAEALRAAAGRLPGEGEIVQKERVLLGEFARAYLTRDADVLAALPAQLLALRQMYEDIQVCEDTADTQQAEALQAERAALQARAEALEKQQALTAQQLEGTLSTINTLVQEYGRGRGQVITPTAEALLQALLSMQEASARAPVVDDIEIAITEVEVPIAAQDAAEQDNGAMDLMVDDALESKPERESLPEAEAVAEAVPEAEAREAVQEAAPEQPVSAPAQTLSSEDIDALLMGALAESPGLEKAAESQLPAVAGLHDAPAPKAAEPVKDEGMDLSVPVEKPKDKAPEPAHDDLDDLDIDALLDAEMGRQAKLLAPAPAPVDDLDLSRTDTPPGK